ncbi:helix-turn-helix domain-containing protein [Streptomyces sp. ISL-1]|uniref:helix-turn-helix domain-containing protein n=1 Tax=Streptomyces sp. ISL-1 TaxID=2817657 RepID=UPI001BE98D35|nr:helix-turn-helix domain-containing protein [Streptomyces sp. ISL-1]MBT2394100.1 helix-turn-helix domain-containing protein [Streptomyces sp. ISL-1]
MSIGNSPEDDRPSIEDDQPSIEDDQPTVEDDRPSIGHALQQARIAAGLTVDEVSSSTRVRIPIVQAIEQDDFSRCGGDVYARGHIRTVARAVGLDPDPLVAQYDAGHGGRPSPTPAAPLFEAERIRPEPRRPNWTAAMVAAIVAVIGFVGFTLFSGGDGKGGQVAEGPAPEQKPGTAAPSTTKPAPPKPDPSDSAIAAVPKDKVTVKLSALDDKSWISAKSHNGKLLFDGLLLKGESKTFQDDERVDLILGNAGAIELFVNGKRVEDEFQTGQVERLSYTKGDPEVG